MKKIKNIWMLVLALVFVLQGSGITDAQAAGVINRLTADYLFENLGDAANYGIVAKTWYQRGHAESNACVDVLHKISGDPFANSENTYAHVYGGAIEATISAPSSLNGMTFALFREKGAGFELCPGTEKTISSEGNTADLIWEFDSALANQQLHVFQMKDGTYVPENGVNGNGMTVNYGPAVFTGANNGNYVGKIVYPAQKGRNDSFKVFNKTFFYPSLVLGPETHLYEMVNNEVQPLTLDNSSESRTVYVNYYYPDPNDSEKLLMEYIKLQEIVYVNGNFIREGNIIYISQGTNQGYASNLVDNARDLSVELANMGGGTIDPAKGTRPNRAGSSTVTGPVDSDGKVVSLYDVEVGDDWKLTWKEDLGIEAMPVADNEYVVVNVICPDSGVDATGKRTGTLTFAGDAGALNYYVEGKNSKVQCGFGKGYGDRGASQRVLYNVVYKDEWGGLQPYQGLIIPHSCHGGTILAPEARLEAPGEVHNGAMIVEEVDNGQELHQRVMGKKYNYTWVAMNAGRLRLEKVTAGYVWNNTYGYWQIQGPLANAVFGIYKNSDCGENSLVMTMTTESTGIATSDMLPAGTYYLKEISVPYGHQLSTAVKQVQVVNGQTITVAGDGYVQEGKNIAPDKFVNFQQEEGGLRIQKKGNDGKMVQGAVFEVFTRSVYDTETVVATLTTNQNGVAVTSRIPIRDNNGKVQTYHVREKTAPEGYKLTTKEWSGQLERDKIITIGSEYFVNEKQIKIQGTKFWNDSENRLNKRPDDVSLTLYRSVEGGSKEEVQTTFTWSDKNTSLWKWETEYLDYYNANGKVYTYSVEEKNVPEGYVADVDGFDITNSYLTNLRLYKVYKDENGENQILNGAKFRIYYDRECRQPVNDVLYETRNYSDTRQGFILFENLKPGIYYVKEEEAPANFVLPNPNKPIRVEVFASDSDESRVNETLPENDISHGVVVNYPEPKSIVVYVSKNWVGDEQHLGDRPDEVVVQLLRNEEPVKGKTLTLNALNGWQGSFVGLEVRDAQNNQYRYAIQEVGSEKLSGYRVKIDGNNNDFVITNTYNLRSIPVTKKWEKVSSSTNLPAVTVQLYKNDQPVTGKTLVLNAANNWKGSFVNLPICDPANLNDNNPIRYSVKEVSGLEEDFYVEYEGNMTDGYTITNTAIGTGKVWLRKVGADADQNGGWTNVHLLEGAKFIISTDTQFDPETDPVLKTDIEGYLEAELRPGKYYIEEYQAPQGYEILWTDHLEFYVNENDNYQLVVNNYAYSGNVGQIYVYGALINKRVGGGFKFTKQSDTGDPIENAVFGIFTDENCQYEHDKVTTDSDGVVQMMGLTAGTTYYIKEISVPNQYVLDDTTVYPVTIEAGVHDKCPDNITNGVVVNQKKEIQKTSVTVTKVWEPNDGTVTHPAEVTVQLLADGTQVMTEGGTVKLNADNKWTHTWDNLDKTDANSNVIAYTVKETAIEGYVCTPTNTENVWTLTNSRDAGKTSVRVSKAWAPEGIVHTVESVSVSLLADEQPVENTTVVLNAENEWKYEWKELPVYKYDAVTGEASRIAYTVAEVNPPVGYTPNVTANPEGSFNFTLTNTKDSEEPEETTIDVTVEKTWLNDAGLEDNRPEEVTVKLQVGETAIDTATLTSENGWKHTFTKLPKFSGGKEIVYTITEDPVPGYYSQVDGFKITNTRVEAGASCCLTMAATKAITGTARTANPAPKFDFAVFVNDEEVAKGWNNDDGQIEFAEIKYTLEDIGERFIYKIKEIQGESQDDTFDYVNWDSTVFTVEVEVFLTPDGKVSHTDPIYRVGESYAENIHFSNQVNFRTGSLALKKVDSENPSIGLAGAQFGIYADPDSPTALYTLTTDDKGEAVQTGLNVGTYYVKEMVPPAGYVSSDKVYTVQVKADDTAVVNAENGGYITNQRTEVPVHLTSITVRKVWEGAAGGEIELILFADGVMMNPQPKPVRNGDAYTYAGLPMYDAAGKLTTYTVQETTMANYTTVYQNPAPYADVTHCAYNGGVIVNQELTRFAVRKVWSGLKADETAPAVKLLLYCNGVLCTDVTPVPTADGWYVYHNLPAMVNGVKAVYSVVEASVDGWMTVYTNTGDYADDVDRAYDGGTILNTRIPQTGDHSHQPLWIAMLVLVLGGWIALRMLGRKWGVN